MKLRLIWQDKSENGYLVRSKYACPCGKGYIDEEQDYTPGFRDGTTFLFCEECEKKYYIEFGDSETHCKLLPISERSKKIQKVEGGNIMPRRSPYSNVRKTNQIRAPHVRGMGDVVFKGFQCLNPDCQEFIFVREDEIGEDFRIVCPKCGYVHESGGETKFYDYSMDVNDDDGNPVSTATGEFTILHDDYIAEAQEYKYCIVCNTLKPLEFFDHHSARASGRQGECRLCKKEYNAIKNGTRLTDQHREAAQKRRLLLDVAGSPKINSKEIEERYHHKCFNCGKDLSTVTDKREKPLDHTLPVYYLWPLSTENATLLCRTCNSNKSGTWPSKFYDDAHLRRLSILTGFDYDLLAGEPQYNPEAIAALHDPEKVDALLEKYAAYMPEVMKLRNRILRDTGFDFFSVSQNISDAYVRQADEMYHAGSKGSSEGAI